MTVQGVDYSHYQNPPTTSHPPDAQRLIMEGIQFVIIKAWEGSNPDPNFTENLKNAQDAGMPVMAYVYLHSGDDAARMDHCFDHIGNVVLCLDWEDANTSATIVEHWMDAYETRYNRKGMAYYGLYPPSDPTERIGQWPRWFPNYASSPRIPPWDGVDHRPDWRNCYAIWQNSASGSVDGIDGLVDTDQLAPALSIEGLIDWLGNSRPPRPQIDVVKPAIEHLQRALNVSGYNAGAPDGLWGPNTQSAIEKYSGYKP